MVVCQACGAENRDRAKFCRGCTAPLSPVAVPPAAHTHPRPSKPVCPACQANNPAAARFCQACGEPLLPASVAHRSMPPMPAAGAAKRKLVLWGLMTVVLAGLGAWWWTGGQGSGPATQVTTPGTMARAGEPTKPPGGLLRIDHAEPGAMNDASVGVDDQRPAGAAETADKPTEAAASTEAERLRQSLERLEREDRLRTAALAQERAARALEQRRPPFIPVQA